MIYISPCKKCGSFGRIQHNNFGGGFVLRIHCVNKECDNATEYVSYNQLDRYPLPIAVKQWNEADNSRGEHERI